MKKNIFAALILFFSLTNQSHAFIGGVHPAKGTYPSSVFMDTLGYDFCTGVVVGKRMLLTAAHCVTGWVRFKLSIGGNLSLSTNSQSDRWDSAYGYVKAIYIHPSWPADLNLDDKKSSAKYGMLDRNISKIVDLAMIEFENDLNLPVASIDYKPLTVGESITMGGFGCRNDKGESKGTLYVALKKVDSIEKNDFLTGKSNLNDTKTSFLCNGDSGGPIYRGTSQKAVVGINSLSSQFWIFKGSNYGVRLDPPGIKTWIQSVFAGKAKVFPLRD